MIPIRTAEELTERLGPMPLHRIVTDPTPGEATATDAERLHEAGTSIEFIDGLLLRKPETDRGLRVTARLREALLGPVGDRGNGLLVGTNALFRLAVNRLRVANLAIIDVPVPPDHRPGERVVSDYPPQLAVEVLGPDHTGREMESKLHEYFTAGTRLAWYVYPALAEVHVYKSLDDVQLMGREDTLDGGDILPGFTLPLADLFGEPK